LIYIVFHCSVRLLGPSMAYLAIRRYSKQPPLHKNTRMNIVTQNGSHSQFIFLITVVRHFSTARENCLMVFKQFLTQGDVAERIYICPRQPEIGLLSIIFDTSDLPHVYIRVMPLCLDCLYTDCDFGRQLATSIESNIINVAYTHNNYFKKQFYT
jgi:hypothetical protein